MATAEVREVSSSRGSAHSALAGLAALLMCLIALAFAWLGAQEYRQSVAETHRQLASTAAAMSEASASAIGGIDRTLILLSEIYRKAPTVTNLDRALRFAGPDTANYPQVRSFAYFDRDGILQAPRPTLGEVPPSVDGRAYFQWQRDPATAGFYIGEPIRGRQSQRWLVPISRRLSDELGSFDGVVVAFLEVDFLARLLSTADVGENGVVTILSETGVIVARSRGGEAVIGRSSHGSKVFQDTILGSRNGGRGVSFIDDVDRYFDAKTIPGTNFLVVAARSRDEVLLSLLPRAAELAGLALVAMLLVAGATRSSLRRVKSEHVSLVSEIDSLRARGTDAINRRLVDILGSIEPVVWICDGEHRVAFVSERANDVLGFSPEEIGRAGGGIHHCVLDDDRERVRAAWDGWSGNAPLHLEYRCIGGDGRMRWIEEHARRITDPDGRSWIDGTSADITQRKKAEEAAHRRGRSFEAALEVSPVALLLLGEDGEVEAANAAALALFGLDLDAMVGTRVWNHFVDPEEVAGFVATSAEDVMTAVIAADHRSTRLVEMRIHVFSYPRDGLAAKGAVVTLWDPSDGCPGRIANAGSVSARLTTGLAHDLRNLLLVIELALERAAAEAHGEPKTAGTLAPAQKALSTSLAIADHVLMFDRTRRTPRLPADIGEILWPRHPSSTVSFAHRIWAAH